VLSTSNRKTTRAEESFALIYDSVVASAVSLIAQMPRARYLKCNMTFNDLNASPMAGVLTITAPVAV